MKTNRHLFITLVSFFILSLFACAKKAEKSIKSTNTEVASKKETVEGIDSSGNQSTPKITVNESKAALKRYYELPHIKEFYSWLKMSYTPPSEMAYPDDLSKLSYDELRLLRNEIFARNGYLFNDGFLRGYFNRFKWYMPIFDVDTFKVVLNQKEKNFVAKILKEERKRKKAKTVPRGNLRLFNSDLIVNYKQFVEVPSKIREDLKKRNFSIIATKRAMPFYVYDQNAYQYIPHYITTDLYLFILHKYFSKFLEKLDENFMSGKLTTLLHKTAQKLSELRSGTPDDTLLPAIEWAQMYTALALFAAGDSLATPPPKYTSIFNTEKTQIEAFKGKPIFIPNRFVSYAELEPRGHYTKSEKLKKYFRGFKWLSTNGIELNNNTQLRGMILLAHIIKNTPNICQLYERYLKTFEMLAGEENNLSLKDIINALPDGNLSEVLNEKSTRAIREQLDHADKNRIKRVFGESFRTNERTVKRVYFFSGTYSVGGEIFSRLVQIDLDHSKRPFPKGLDIPAVFGNKTAQNILINEYHENERWKEYLPRLNELQKQFSNFHNWNQNYGFKALQTALSSFAEHDNYPDFMKTDAYNRKELSTALASWTHIKHDLILYQEKPFAAECGQGGGPEPPQHYSYVEPNLTFWDSALDLVDWLKNLLHYESTYKDELNRIYKLGNLLKTVAHKQLDGEEITKKEFDDLHYVGGTIEYILLGLLETDHLPVRERSMALIADVYSYNSQNLNVAVGHADDIHVVVPIRGEYYIARGAVFSYYEFVGKTYTDEEWRKLIKENKEPERPAWIKPIITGSKPLKGQMQFRY